MTANRSNDCSEPTEVHAEQMTLEESQRAATVLRRARGRQSPTPEVMGAIARTKRLMESLRSTIDLLAFGTENRADAEFHDRLAKGLDRLWKTYMRRPDMEQEAALRFLEAVEYSLRVNPEAKPEERLAQVRDFLAARFPEYAARIDSKTLEIAVNGFRGRAKKAPALLEAVSLVIAPNVYKDEESLRIAYLKWLKDSGWKPKVVRKKSRRDG